MGKAQRPANGLDEFQLDERFRALLDEIRATATSCQPGTGIDSIERTILSKGLDLLRLIAESEAQRAQ